MLPSSSQGEMGMAGKKTAFFGCGHPKISPCAEIFRG